MKIIEEYGKMQVGEQWYFYTKYFYYYPDTGTRTCTAEHLREVLSEEEADAYCDTFAAML